MDRSLVCRRFAACCSAAALVIGLSACGGGGGDATDPSVSDPVAPDPALTISGTVIDGPIKGASVCLDLNANGQCDAGEPASGSTDDAGRFTVQAASADQLRDAACLAMVPADAIDMDAPGQPVGAAFAMAAPAGKCGLVSPITTLLQRAIAGGMPQAEAEQAVAAQLALSKTESVYLNYVDDPAAADSAMAGMMSRDALVPALKAGQTLAVAPLSTLPRPSIEVVRFVFTDTDNYSWRYFTGDNVMDDQRQVSFLDRRMQWFNGSPVDTADLYTPEWEATPNATSFEEIWKLTESMGWTHCDQGFVHKATLGTPSIRNLCGGDRQHLTQWTEDISGQPVADVLDRIQRAELVSVVANPTLLQPAVFPEGSAIAVRAGGEIFAANVWYRESGNRVDSLHTLEELLDDFPYPLPGQPSEDETVSLGFTSGSTIKVYRAAFGADGIARYWSCEVVNGACINWQEAGSGAWAITSYRGSPVMTLANQPNESEPGIDYLRVFVARDDKVWAARQPKPARVPASIHLNGVAGEFLASLLGITPPWQQPQ